MTVFTQKSISCQIPVLNEIYERIFPGKSDGFFVEVGAFDGYEWSNVWGLAQIGWRGLCFEPVPGLAERCRERYVGKPVAVVQAAVGAIDGEIKLYTTGNPTINLETVERSPWGYRYDPSQFIISPLCALNTALAAFQVPPAFDLLSIDVEGAELEVLAGINFSIWRPRMMIVETCKNHPDPGFRFHAQQIENVVLGAGFQEIYFDHINSIYVRD